MSKKHLALMLAGVLLISILAGCTGAKQEDNKPVFLSIATGGTAGTYNPLGGALAKIFNEKLKNVTANAQVTGASAENVGLLGKKEVELAFIQNDITHYAFTGTETFKDKQKITNIKGMAMLYPELVQLVATKDSGITSVNDLKGKKVAIGAPGSGVEANARQILEAHGIKYADLGKADFLSFAEAATQLKNKQIDAAFITAGIPTAAITEVAQTSDIVIIPVEKAKITELQKKYPFYTEVVIPAGTYKGQTKDVTTAAVMAMLVVRDDLSETLVYNLTKAMFENRQIIIDTHKRGNDIKLETALAGMPIELHKGAKKYFDEKGIKK